jgi:HEAT repeat protein
VDEQLAALDAPPKARAEQVAALASALGARHYRVVAKAARLAEDGLHYDLLRPLQAAYARFLEKPVKTDPNCLAKKAIARALVTLDCSDSEFFSAGVQYRQLEPVWGGTADTAVDVRTSCAMGLVATGYPRALVELTALLHDAEPMARAGAVRAIACGNPREAELLLRSKVQGGDPEPAVQGECFTALLALEPDESVAFVARYLKDADPAVGELAALALGESRLPAALAPLRAAWEEVLVADEFRRALLRAAAAHRSEAAFDWLIGLAAEARTTVARDVIGALAPYKHNMKLGARLRAVLEARGERTLINAFAERFAFERSAD